MFIELGLDELAGQVWETVVTRETMKSSVLEFALPLLLPDCSEPGFVEAVGLLMVVSVLGLLFALPELEGVLPPVALVWALLMLPPPVGPAVPSARTL